MNPECTDFHNGVFLMAHSGEFKCPRCHKIGRKVMEYGETDTLALDFWQVRVDFNYDVVSNDFRAVAIVSDESLSKSGNIYRLYTPILKTEKRALQTAEQILGALMRADNSIFAKGYVPKDQVYNLDFDLPLAEVKSKLSEIQDVVQRSRLSNGTNLVFDDLKGYPFPPYKEGNNGIQGS